MQGTWRWISLESGDCSNSFKLSTHKFVFYARLISSLQILNLFFLFRSHFPRLTITLFLRSSLVTSALSCPDSRNYSSTNNSSLCSFFHPHFLCASFQHESMATIYPVQPPIKSLSKRGFLSLCFEAEQTDCTSLSIVDTKSIRTLQ